LNNLYAWPYSVGIWRCYVHLPAKFNREILIFHAIVEQNLFDFAGKLIRPTQAAS
jgi:hypothetical protein